MEREGRGHTALLYSHRYRGGISIAASRKMGEGGREGDREGEGEGEREHHISAMLSQHVNVMHVLIELGIFRGHVLMGSYGLKKGERLAALSTRHRDEKLPRVCRRFHDRSERLRVTVQQV